MEVALLRRSGWLQERSLREACSRSADYFIEGSGRIAARLVYQDLSAAHDSVVRAREAGSLDLNFDSKTSQETWKSQREALARGLRTRAFMQVADAFQVIQLVASEIPPTAEGVSAGHNQLLAAAVTVLNAGRNAALQECFSPWERLTGASRKDLPGPVRSGIAETM
jgi:hypothetical protein